MILEVKSVSILRNSRILFSNFSLKINSNQVLIILGSNGVGKSTLMDAVAGLIKPDKGLIKICGKSLSEIENKKKDYFTYLPHKDALKENLTVAENLKIWASIADINFEREKFLENLKFFNLKHLKNEPIRNLSQGQRKKVHLTKLLFTNTKFWMLDEPLNGLDKITINKVKELIKRHIKSRGAVFLSTHVDFNLHSAKKVSLNDSNGMDKKKFKFDNWSEF